MGAHKSDSSVMDGKGKKPEPGLPSTVSGPKRGKRTYFPPATEAWSCRDGGLANWHGGVESFRMESNGSSRRLWTGNLVPIAGKGYTGPYLIGGSANNPV